MGIKYQQATPLESAGKPLWLGLKAQSFFLTENVGLGFIVNSKFYRELRTLFWRCSFKDTCRNISKYWLKSFGGFPCIWLMTLLQSSTWRKVSLNTVVKKNLLHRAKKTVNLKILRNQTESDFVMLYCLVKEINYVIH